ncbi:HpcH/HpaI aldolase/citrate lyase family protein [Rudaea cellulosilytica]|uniref:HpcH/HpaI aldolase/citrate lyase family protein n=1 Tax=Rudaea cellulosilytica TaxID=540746 RepID=UPI0003661944|nr:CoA ester lyase [Rudaea cellulosilytica]
MAPLIRSKLFLPGSRPELFAKGATGAADALSFDLEDAVPEDAKAVARRQVAEFVQSGAAREAGKLVIVRVNALGTPHFVDDIKALAVPCVDLINLPKCESADEVRAAAAAIAHMESSDASASAGLLVNIESAKGLRHAAQIAAAHPRVRGLQLGLGDLFEPLGIDRYDPANVHAAMFALRLAAGEAGVWCLDGARADVVDEAGYLAEARMARSLGFIGKTCIHPKQVVLANSAFALATDEVEFAQRVVAAAREAAALGRGAFTVDGRMIDAPFLRRAEAILAAAGER